MAETSIFLAGNLTDGEPAFFAVIVWREQAEHVAASLAKGSRLWS